MKKSKEEKDLQRELQRELQKEHQALNDLIHRAKAKGALVEEIKITPNDTDLSQ